MYTTPNGKLLPRDPAMYIGPPGFNSRQSPFANIDYGVACEGARGSVGSCCMSGVAPVLRAQQYCFEPAFITRGKSGFGTCLYTATADNVSSSQLAESSLASQRYSHGGSDFCSGNAKVTKILSAEEYEMFQQANGGSSLDSTNTDSLLSESVGPYINPRRTGMMLLDDGSGSQVVACPIPVDPHVDNQYQQAILDVWQPNRFAETNKPEAYAVTSDIRDTCFYKDVTFPNGTTMPLAVRMTPKCIAAAEAAVAQINPSVSSKACCNLHDPRR